MPGFLMPNSAPPPVNQGLMIGGAVSNALSQGLLTYMQRKDANDKKKQEDVMLSIKAKDQGLVYDPDRGTLSNDPNAQAKKEAAQAEKTYGLLTEDQKNSSYGHGLLMKLSGQSPQGEISNGDREPQGQIPLQSAQNPPDPFAPLPGYKNKRQREMDDALELFKKKKDYESSLSGPDTGKVVPAGNAEGLGKANASFKKLDDLETTISQNKNSFGPVAGRLAGLNPYDTTSQAIKAQTLAAIQDIGTYLEGGKLTDMDIPKYEKMMPNIKDTPEVASEKAALIRKLVSDKQASEKEALSGAGYNTSGIKTGSNNKKTPGLLKPKEDVSASAWSDEKERRLQELRKKLGK